MLLTQYLELRGLEVVLLLDNFFRILSERFVELLATNRVRTQSNFVPRHMFPYCFLCSHKCYQSF